MRDPKYLAMTTLDGQQSSISKGEMYLPKEL